MTVEVASPTSQKKIDININSGDGDNSQFQNIGFQIGNPDHIAFKQQISPKFSKIVNLNNTNSGQKEQENFLSEALSKEI